jgi:hypothetical protein
MNLKDKCWMLSQPFISERATQNSVHCLPNVFETVLADVPTDCRRVCLLREEVRPLGHLIIRERPDEAVSISDPFSELVELVRNQEERELEELLPMRQVT